MSEPSRVDIFDKPRRWWKPSDQVRWMVRGALYAVGVVLLLAACFFARIVWVRSFNGELAYEYIQQVIAQQQKASQPPAKP